MTQTCKPLRPKFVVAGLAALFAFGAGAAFAAGKDVVIALSNQPDSLDPYNTNTTLTTAGLNSSSRTASTAATTR